MSGSTLELSRDEMVVGRRADCDLVLEDDYVSRRHAVVRTSAGSVSVEDLGSTGGTFVNGDRISAPTRLRDGNTVRFGGVDTLFRAGTLDPTTVPDAVPARPTVPFETPVVRPAPLPAARSVVARDGSIVCLACGTKNRAGSSFCSNNQCGAFLEFYGADTPTSVPVVGGAPPGPQTGPRRAGVAASLVPDRCSVDPGAETAGQLSVRNQGTIVDAFDVTVSGEAARWASVEPARLSLMPGAEGMTTVRWAPPREPGAGAGAAPFQIRVTSADDPTAVATVDGILDVEAFHVMAVELVPATSRGQRRGEHRFTIENGGNRPLAVDIEAADPDVLLQLVANPSHVVVEPGTSAVGRVQVRARRNLWWGPSRTLPLRVTATPDIGEPIRADGGFTQTPLFPRWFRKALLWPIGMAALVTAAVLMIVKPWKPPPKPVQVPDCVQSPIDQEGCALLLTNAGLTLAPVRKASHPTAPVNQVLKSEPVAGSEVKKGTAVLLTISDGRKVPADLVGRPEQEAVRILEGLGLGFKIVKEEGGQPGRVSRTVPAPGTVLSPTELVEVYVSTGATTTTSSSTTTSSTVPRRPPPAPPRPRPPPRPPRSRR